MDWMLMLYLTLGAIVGFAVRIAAGALAERRRSAADRWLSLSTDLQAAQRKLNAVGDRQKEVEQLMASMQQLVKASAPSALIDLGERVSKLEARDAQLHLQVMDQAEKVSRRLNDRERKRRDVREEELDEDALPLHDRDLMLAEARKQYPLFPGDVVPEPVPAGEPE